MDTDIHYAHIKIGIFRDVFVTKEKRGYAKKLVKFVEKNLSGLGVKSVYAAERFSNGNKIGEFYEAMGYVPQECLWGKKLGQ